MIRLTLHHSDLGAVSVDRALTAFRDFPWARELADSNRFDTPAPTFLLSDDESRMKLAASIVDGPPHCDQLEFLLFYVVPGKPHDVSFNSAGHEPSVVEAALRAYFSDDHETLKQILRIEQTH